MVDWDDSFLVGVPSVDRDHKAILDSINGFIGIIDSHAGISDIHDGFRAMQSRIYRHLANEEHMLTAIGYADADEHAQVHEKLTDTLDAIWDEMLSDDDFSPNDAARSWLEGWLFQHVKTEDFQYRDWVQANGLQAAAESAMKRDTNP